MDTSFQHVLIWHLAIIFGHPHYILMDHFCARVHLVMFHLLEWYCPIFSGTKQLGHQDMEKSLDKKSSHSWCQTWQGRSKSSSKKVGHLGELGDAEKSSNPWKFDAIMWDLVGQKVWNKTLWLLNVLFHGHKSYDLIKAPRRQQFPKLFKHHSFDLFGQNRYLLWKSWKVVRRAQLWGELYLG